MNSTHINRLPKLQEKIELSMDLLWCKHFLKSMHVFFIIRIFPELFKDPAYV